MLSLSPTFAKRCADALETVARAPLSPIVNRETPRNLASLPPAIRSLPADLQVVALCDMLADARAQRNDRNSTVRELRQRLMFSEQACGRALRELDKERSEHAETAYKLACACQQIEALSR